MDTQKIREAVTPREKVESSQLASVGYDPTRRVLEVEFKGGSVYRYDNIEQAMFTCLMASESKGKFFGTMIKKFPQNFPFLKVRGTDREEAKGNPPV